MAAVQMFDLVGSGFHQDQLPAQGSSPVLEVLLQTGFSVQLVGSLVGHKTWSESALESGIGLALPGSCSGAPKVDPTTSPAPKRLR